MAQPAASYNESFRLGCGRIVPRSCALDIKWLFPTTDQAYQGHPRNMPAGSLGLVKSLNTRDFPTIATNIVNGEP